MQCPVCSALNREHSRECEAEATATLRQRCQSLLPLSGTTSVHDPVDSIVLNSRKRQASITFRLDQHRAQDHRLIMEDKRPVVA